MTTTNTFDINFLFWNTCNKSLINEINEIVIENNIDVIFLVEYDTENLLLSQNLKSNLGVDFFDNNIGRIFKGFKLVSKFESVQYSVKEEDSRYIIFTLEIGRVTIIVGVCHLPSKLYLPEDSDRRLMLQNFKEDIELLEDQTNNNKVILVGDFNYDPFEQSFVSLDGINTTMSKEVALGKTRRVAGREAAFFYNPMWSFYGDNGKGSVNGTYFRNSNRNVNYYWHILDQVLIRPELIPNFSDDSLDILTETSNYKFTRKGKDGIQKVNGNISDHLPIKFNIVF
jgi:exonuclease III